jgi:hypothetical protein
MVAQGPGGRGKRIRSSKLGERKAQRTEMLAEKPVYLLSLTPGAYMKLEEGMPRMYSQHLYVLMRLPACLPVCMSVSTHTQRAYTQKHTMHIVISFLIRN